MKRVLIICFLSMVLTEVGRSARAQSQPADPQVTFEAVENKSRFKTHSLFANCDSDCRFTLSFGRSVDTRMDHIFFRPVAPWDWDFGGVYFVSANIARPWVTIGDYISLEPEIGIGKRMGDANEVEVWGALYLRWHKFPWNKYVATTVAISTGLNYATGIARVEALIASRSGRHIPIKLLHYFSPEVTFALPDHPNYSAQIRMHHRSAAGIWGNFAGIQYLMFGIRRHFCSLLQMNGKPITQSYIRHLECLFRYEVTKMRIKDYFQMSLMGHQRSTNMSLA